MLYKDCHVLVIGFNFTILFRFFNYQDQIPFIRGPKS